MEKNPSRSTVTCEIDGKTYRGTCWIAGKILTVFTGLGGKSRQVGTVLRIPLKMTDDSGRR